MSLSETEAENLRAVGTVLREFLPAGDEVEWNKRGYFRKNATDKRKFIRKARKSLEPGYGLYGMETDCGFLEETPEGRAICSVHEDPELKPKVCEKFDAGTRACNKVRARVLNQMHENDELIPDFASVALGRTALQTFDAAA